MGRARRVFGERRPPGSSHTTALGSITAMAAHGYFSLALNKATCRSMQPIRTPTVLDRAREDYHLVQLGVGKCCRFGRSGSCFFVALEIGIVFGTFLALPQLVVIRKRIRRAMWWPAITGITWALVMSVMLRLPSVLAQVLGASGAISFHRRLLPRRPPLG